MIQVTQSYVQCACTVCKMRLVTLQVCVTSRIFSTNIMVIYIYILRSKINNKLSYVINFDS